MTDNCCPIQDKKYYAQFEQLSREGRTTDESELARRLCKENRYHHGIYQEISPSIYSEGGVCTETWFCWNCDWQFEHSYYKNHPEDARIHVGNKEEQIRTKFGLADPSSAHFYSPETIEGLCKLTRRLFLEQYLLGKREPWFFKLKRSLRLRDLKTEIMCVQAILENACAERIIDYYHRAPEGLPIVDLSARGYYLVSQNLESDGRFHAVFRSKPTTSDESVWP
jgi:hypothetical protein